MTKIATRAPGAASPKSNPAQRLPAACSLPVLAAAVAPRFSTGVPCCSFYVAVALGQRRRRGPGCKTTSPPGQFGAACCCLLLPAAAAAACWSPAAGGAVAVAAQCIGNERHGSFSRAGLALGGLCGHSYTPPGQAGNVIALPPRSTSYADYLVRYTTFAIQIHTSDARAAWAPRGHRGCAGACSKGKPPLLPASCCSCSHRREDFPQGC